MFIDLSKMTSLVAIISVAVIMQQIMTLPDNASDGTWASDPGTQWHRNVISGAMSMSDVSCRGRGDIVTTLASIISVITTVMSSS